MRAKRPGANGNRGETTQGAKRPGTDSSQESEQSYICVLQVNQRYPLQTEATFQRPTYCLDS